MKELSIEEKACYYDEAVINGSRLWECGKITRETYEYIFPELKESEDERIRGAILHFISHTPTVPKGLISKEDMIGWLEKQSEQEVNEPDWCHHKVDLSDCSEEYRKAYYDGWNNCNQQHSQCNAEQKPADKVESKFKVGDWVVSPNGVYWHIDAIQNGRYEVTADTGQCGNWPLDTNIYRLWTIQDAKNGDVLSDGTTIFIFKDLLSDGSVISYCDYDTDSGESDAFCPLSVNLICSKITPATKEQRDLLFEKMHEARYEWDAEKKELEKQGEQRAAWSEEDEKMIGRIRGIIEAYAFSQSAVDVNGDLCEKKFIDADIWLKSLKEKIGG